MKKYFKQILFVCLLCTLTLCLFVGGKTLKVKADETYNFANITEEESLDFLAEHNIEIPAIFHGNREEIGKFTQNAIKLVYENPSYEFVYNYDKTLNFANDIKQAVLPYLNEQNITTQSCAPYSLMDSTVKNSNGEWVAQGGAWDNKWLKYNCYAFALTRNEQPAFYNTGKQYQPGDMAPGDDDFFTVKDISGFANLVKQDLVAMGYNNIVLSTTIPSITTEQSLICVRRGSNDYHFMKYDLTTDSWYHKPGETAILKYNGIPNNSRIWTNENSQFGWESAASTKGYYDSEIYFIKYDKNVANISSSTSSSAHNLNVNADKDSILEIRNSTNNKYYRFYISADYTFRAQIFDADMEQIGATHIAIRTYLYELLSNKTYYLKIFFDKSNDETSHYGNVFIEISAHNHQLTYQNNSSNHRETCSVCGYDEVVSHAYTNSYTRYNSTQHTAFCACGASKVENHSYTARYQDADSSTHTAYCVCGASTSINHSYTHRFKKKDTTSHYSYCVCGRYITSGHVINGVLPGKQYAICILCKGQAEIGLIEMGLSEIMSNRIITANGSYILPNGIIVLSDADYQNYLNGTFVIPHSHDVAA